MLLKRDNTISTECTWFYNVNEHKTICFHINRDRSIERISLVDIDSDEPSFRHDVKSLCYMECLTTDDCELLSTDALLDLAKREDTNA